VRTSLKTLLLRALLKRCPRCGRKKIFATFFRLGASCPNCGYVFERQEGYWVGALIVNIAVAEAWFFVLLMVVVFSTSPDVPWFPLLVVALVTNGLLPVIFYPHSKAFWMAIDLYIHPVKEEDPDNSGLRDAAR
jgi:uncharacterized protein (DUF983 family)